MPKINSAGVVTNVDDPDKTVAEQIAEAHGVDVDEMSTELDESNEPVKRDEDKEVETSPGNSSSASKKPQEKTQNSSEEKDRSPALTTESPFKKDQTDNSSAASTGGSQSKK